MPRYGHPISGSPLSPSGGSGADSGYGRSGRDVLGAIGKSRGSKEEAKGGAARRRRGRALRRCLSGDAGVGDEMESR